VNLQSNSSPTFASTPDGQLTSVGLNFVCRDTTSTTDLAAPSGLMVEPHPLRNTANVANRSSKARRIVAVLQIRSNATTKRELATASMGVVGRYDPGMGNPIGVHGQQPKPPVSGSDLALSLTALALTAVVIAAAAFLGLFSLAFLDYCPPESCSAEGAGTAVVTTVIVALAIAAVGLTVTVVQLYRRRPAWPFAFGALALCVIAFFVGGLGYISAVGG
jgi:hypothetical protein